jgi:AraC-like DNA-binding protein
MHALNQLLTTLKIEANVFHNGQYCGIWAVDTSGQNMMTFHVVSAGNCYLNVDEQTLELQTGDAIFFPNDAKHRASSLAVSDMPANQATSSPMTETLEEEATGLVCGNFGHDHPLFEKLLKQLPSYIVIRANQNIASAGIIDLMLQESRQSDQNTNLLLNRLSDCLFYTLIRDHLDTKSGLFSALVHPNLSKSLELIHAATDVRLSLEELASAAGMSRSAYASLFKEIVGQSPIEYITQWKMTQAYRWLADDEISTLAAALQCGYESEASFAKAFKRAMGVGPGQVRGKGNKL